MGLLKSKINFYGSMSMMYNAGLKVSRALRQRHPGPIGKIAVKIADGIEKQGSTMSEQMRLYPWVFSNLECQLVRAGEQTGRMEEIFKSLAEWFRQEGRLKGSLISDMIYPTLLFHFAAFIIPFISFIIGKGTVFGVISQIIGFLSPPYLIFFIFMGLKILNRRFNIQLPDQISRIFLSMPVIGPLARKGDYVRFFGIYGLAIDAGMPVTASVCLAADACQNSFIKSVFRQTAQKIESDRCPFTEAYMEFVFPADRESPPMSILETGELSGKMSETSRKVAETYQFEFEENLKLLANIVPKAIYFLIMLYLAITIIGFWSKIFANINNTLSF